MNLDDIIREEARLIMLRALREQPNLSATSTSMRKHLVESFLIAKSREWVEQEFAWMADMGAIRVSVSGSVKVATLIEGGREHLAHHRFIPGVLISTDPVL